MPAPMVPAPAAASVRTKNSISKPPSVACSSAVRQAMSRVDTPVRPACASTGVPSAPKATPAAWPSRASTTAVSAGTPSPTSSGATSAMGVPKPAAPSKNRPRHQPSSSTCSGRCWLTRARPARSASSAPQRCWCSCRARAGSRIHRMPTVRKAASASTPRWRATGPTCATGDAKSNTATASTQASSSPAPPACAADQRRPSISATISAIGAPAAAADQAMCGAPRPAVRPTRRAAACPRPRSCRRWRWWSRRWRASHPR